MKIFVRILLLLLSFVTYSQYKGKEILSFKDPVDARNTFSDYVGRQLTFDKKSKATVTLFVFKINSKSGISEIKNWGKLDKNVENEVNSVIKNSELFWMFTDSDAEEQFVILPLFIGNPFKKKQGSDIFLSLENQFALVRGYLGSNLTNVYLSFPRKSSAIFQVNEYVE
jgi:hypothetical protein